MGFKNGIFKNGNLLRAPCKAAMEKMVPAPAGSWQAMDGLAVLHVEGYVKVDWPCQSNEDPETGEMVPIPLIYSGVIVNMALGTAKDPILVRRCKLT